LNASENAFLILHSNSTLTCIDISNNKLMGESDNIYVESTKMKEGDLVEYMGEQCPVSASFRSGYRVHILHGVLALTRALGENTTLSCINVLQTKLQIADVKVMVNAFVSSSTLNSVCGFCEDQISADFSRRNELTLADAMLLAADLQHHRSLTSLILSDNDLSKESSNVEGANELKRGDMVEYMGEQCPVSCSWGSGYRVHMIHGLLALSRAFQESESLTHLSLDIRAHMVDAKVAVQGCCSVHGKEFKQITITDVHDDYQFPKYSPPLPNTQAGSDESEVEGSMDDEDDESEVDDSGDDEDSEHRICDGRRASRVPGVLMPCRTIVDNRPCQK
jgi:hypothetical protein